MNVDVSPDGAELLFDLLGDIYTVPSAVRAHMCASAASQLMIMAFALLYAGR